MNYKITIQHNPLLSIIIIICFSLFLQVEEGSLQNVYRQSNESNVAINNNNTNRANLVVMPTAIDFGNVHIYQTSDVKSYTLTGFNLTSDVAITAPYPFQVSLNESSGFSSSMTIPANDVIISTVIYVRMHPSATGEYFDAINHTTPGVLPVSVTLSGTCVETSIEVSPASIDFGEVKAGVISEPQAYVLSYQNLIEDLVITSSSDRFEISLNKYSGYGSSITIPAAPLNKRPKEVTYQDGYNVARGERPPIDLNNVPKDAYEPGKMFIKLKPHIGKSLPARRLDAGGEGYVITGIPFLDTLNRQFGVKAYKPMFAALYNTNSRTLDYRERHEAWGFHLWFELVVDEYADIIEAVKSFNLLEDIEIAEPVYKTRQNNYTDQKEVNTFLPVEPNKTDEKPDGKSGWSPNDPYYSSQWHYNNTGQSGGTPGADISLENAWEIEKGHPDVIVAVVDGGIQADHPDLADNMWEGIGYNFYHDSPNIIPDNHGTHVAGTVAAVNNNELGVAGVAGGSGVGDGVKMISCQIFIPGFDNGLNPHLAIVYGADNGAAISQNSWSYSNAGYYNQSVLDAIDYFNLHGGGDVMHGGISVFGAGNENDNGHYYPAYYSETLSVAATNNWDWKALYSNFGNWIDISAPGGETVLELSRGVRSTVTNNEYGYMEGTSMAAPHVSGVAALLISYAHRNGITLTNTDVWELLVNNTDDIYDLNFNYIGMLGSGRLNAYQSLMAINQQETVWVRFVPESPGAANTTISNSSYAYNEFVVAQGTGVEDSFDCGNQITDIDGNVYNTVQIGNQCWMAENLKTTKYRNAIPVENPENNSDWLENTVGAYSWYDNNASLYGEYGLLYNWHAVNNPEGLCPTGWRVPSDEEWTQLTNYLSNTNAHIYAGNAGNYLKSCRQVNSPLGGDCQVTEHPRWNEDDTHFGTDDFGFSALPGGYRDFSGLFSNVGAKGVWWTMTGEGSMHAWFHRIRSISGYVNKNMAYQSSGYNVRCVRDENVEVTLPDVSTEDIADVTATTVSVIGNVTNEGGATVTSRGVVWSADVNPTLEDNDGFTDEGSGPGEFSSSITGLSPETVYSVRAYATNSQGTSYGITIIFNTPEGGDLDIIYGDGVTDIDGNDYLTVIIGEQEWMAENLRVTKYKNGDQIPLGPDGSDWGDLTEGAYAIYPHVHADGLNSDEEMVDAYGKLYNWHAVADSRGLCPAGWRMPVSEDWDILINYVDPDADGNDNIAGVKLKSCRQKVSPLGGDCETDEHPLWSSHNTNYGTDNFGFAAFPGGGRNPQGSHLVMGFHGYWWSSSEYSASKAYVRGMFYTSINVFDNNLDKSFGISVRCLKDESFWMEPPSVITAPITNITHVNASGGGNVTDDGGAEVTVRGVVWNTTENPTIDDYEGYTNDGQGTGEFISTLYSLNPETTYYVRAYATNNVGTAYGEQESFTTSDDDDISYGTVTDIDNNVYQTVIIGNQEWMAENLRVTRDASGNNITRYCYNNDTTNCELYGGLYTWHTVMNGQSSSSSNPSGVQGICPTGWHVPSDAEWTELVNYVVSQGFPNSNVVNGAGNALKSCRQVGSPLGGECNTSEHPRWNSDGTHHGFDEFGFSALPGGFRSTYGGFGYLGARGYWWSSTEYSSANAWSRGMRHGSGNVGIDGKPVGFSLRCVRDLEEPAAYTLQLNVQPEYSGSVSGAGQYLTGTEVNIHAEGNEGWEFVNWTGDTDYIDNPDLSEATLPMPTYDISLTAIFVEAGIPVQLQLSEEAILSGETECFDALQTITVFDFTVEVDGIATLIAGQSIHLLPRTTVEHGGYLLARIAAHENDYCGIPRSIEITKEPVTAKGEDVVSADFPYKYHENGFFKLYPNPTDGVFTLEFTNGAPEQTITVEVYSMFGGRLFTKELPPERLHTLSLDGQLVGLYIIRVVNGDKVGVMRLIKQ